jgi:glycosyltransferase involved in cell wall biosynthesis
MPDVPAVLVVIPLYNKGPYIARALNSVLAQTFQDFEVIVVDDGSTDNGAEVVRGFDDPRIRLIQQENGGVSAARNRGIEKAQAELVAFLDADDEWLPEHLETIWGLRLKYPNAGAYATAYIFSDGNGKENYPKYRAIPPEPWEGLLPNYFRANALGEHPISSSSVGVPKLVLDEIGGFQIGAWYGEDEDLWGRIALKYPIAFCWNIGAIYHRDAKNRVCKREIPRPKSPFINNAQRMIESGIISEKIVADLIEYIEKEEIERATWYALRGGKQKALEILSECTATNHTWRRYQVSIITKIPERLLRSLRQLNGN